MEEILQELRELKAELKTADRPLKVSEAVKFLGLKSESWFRKEVMPKIKHYKVGKNYYFYKEDLHRYIQSEAIQPEGTFVNPLDKYRSK